MLAVLITVFTRVKGDVHVIQTSLISLRDTYVNKLVYAITDIHSTTTCLLNCIHHPRFTQLRYILMNTASQYTSLLHFFHPQN
jgi:hypothetical protein